MSPGDTPDYQVALYQSIDEIEDSLWQEACAGDPDLFISRKFLRAFERSMSHLTSFHHAIVRDQQGLPQAAACLTVFQADLAEMTEGLTARLARFFKPVARRLIEVKLVFCGLPFSSGCHQLRIRPEADRLAVYRALDRSAGEIARQARAKCIIFKDVPDREDLQPDLLTSLGYRRGANLPKNQVFGQFSDFDDYCRSLKARKRSTLKRSRRKFADAGLTVQHLRGNAGAKERLTEEVHRLYLAVFSRAHTRLEVLPLAFFHEIAGQLGERSLFTFVDDREGRTVGFALSLIDLPAFYQLFIGVDYEVNALCDLYFNIFYEVVDEAFRLGATLIDVGQTSDEFKRQKLGARQIPTNLYLKGVNWLTRLALQVAFEAFLPRQETPPESAAAEE